MLPKKLSAANALDRTPSATVIGLAASGTRSVSSASHVHSSQGSTNGSLAESATPARIACAELSPSASLSDRLNSAALRAAFAP